LILGDKDKGMNDKERCAVSYKLFNKEEWPVLVIISFSYIHNEFPLS
jgi:hypothetical protein